MKTFETFQKELTESYSKAWGVAEFDYSRAKPKDIEKACRRQNPFRVGYHHLDYTQMDTMNVKTGKQFKLSDDRAWSDMIDIRIEYLDEDGSVYDDGMQFAQVDELGRVWSMDEGMGMVSIYRDIKTFQSFFEQSEQVAPITMSALKKAESIRA